MEARLAVQVASLDVPRCRRVDEVQICCLESEKGVMSVMRKVRCA